MRFVLEISRPLYPRFELFGIEHLHHRPLDSLPFKKFSIVSFCIKVKMGCSKIFKCLKILLTELSSINKVFLSLCLVPQVEIYLRKIILSFRHIWSSWVTCLSRVFIHLLFFQKREKFILDASKLFIEMKLYIEADVVSLDLFNLTIKIPAKLQIIGPSDLSF